MEETTTQVMSQVDGRPLEMVSVGVGAGVVILHGGGIDASVYRRLAKRLSVSFTVHIYNRWGRGRSAPRPDDYGLQTDIRDLASVLDATGATRVVGHSMGGFFALVAARELPIQRLALFDPAVDVDGPSPPTTCPSSSASSRRGTPTQRCS